MGQAIVTPLSFDELYARIRALPQGITGEILEPGIVRTMSRPGKPHRWTHRALIDSVRGFDHAVGGTGWWIEVEAEIRFPLGRLIVPDLSGFRISRVPEVPEESPLTILPDWCCEVLSPSTDRVDRTVKLPLYARSGVPWIWIVDPANRTIEVFETVEGRPALTVVAGDETRAALPPFGDFDLTHCWLPQPKTHG